MTVYLVGAGPGDPGLLTVRGADVLRRADVVLYDRLSVASLLELAPAGAELIPVGKTPRGPSTPQEEINRLLVERGRAGQTVVRLKGGDPFVFARGGEEAAALADAGVSFEVVPGITSAIAVPAYAGVPVTARGLATSFTVVTGHEDPWAATETDWAAVARLAMTGGTIVVLMGVATRAAIAAHLIDSGLDRSTPVAAVTWGTRPEQHTVRTTLGGLGDTPVGSTSVIVIGAVAGLDLAWFERRPLFGRRVVVTRAASQAGTLAGRIDDLGAEVIELPTIDVVAAADGGRALAAAALSASTYDWVLFTSANAVARFVPLLRDARGFGSAKVAAVGPSTAEVLNGFGIVADVVPAKAVAEALADALPAAPARALLPQAAGARPVLRDGLVGRGWTVDTVEAYRTVTAAADDTTLARLDGADAVTFTSASTVTGFLEVAGRDRVPKVVVSIGPITTRAAEESGIEVSAEADPHTIPGLVDALVAVLGS